MRNATTTTHHADVGNVHGVVSGECVLALKGMFDSPEQQDFECSLTHHGEETGKLR